jgi:hypothetical protein
MSQLPWAWYRLLLRLLAGSRRGVLRESSQCRRCTRNSPRVEEKPATFLNFLPNHEPPFHNPAKVRVADYSGVEAGSNGRSVADPGGA